MGVLVHVWLPRLMSNEKKRGPRPTLAVSPSNRTEEGCEPRQGCGEQIQRGVVEGRQHWAMLEREARKWRQAHPKVSLQQTGARQQSWWGVAPLPLCTGHGAG